MNQTKSVAIPNGVLLVMDQKSTQVPASMGTDTVTRTASCVALKTVPGAEGETTVTVTDEEIPPHDHVCVFRDSLKLGSSRLVVATSENMILFEFAMPSRSASISIWANDESEPSSIYVIVPGAGE